MGALDSGAKKIFNLLGMTGLGNLASTNSLSITLASDDNAATGIGTTTQAAVEGDTAGSLNAKARGTNKILGTTADAGVITDTSGTLSAKLRGIVVLLGTLLGRLPASLGAQSAGGSLSVVPATAASWTVATGASDDAAAAGQLFAAAGLYQTATAVDEVDTGDVGRARMSTRRALLQGPDFVTGALTGVGGAGIEEGSSDVQVSSSAQTGYGAAGGALGFGALSTTQYFRVPVGAAGWRACSLALKNTLNVDVQVAVYLAVTGSTAAGDLMQVDTAAMTSTRQLLFTPEPGGATPDSYYRSVPALKAPTAYVVVAVVISDVPGSGQVSLFAARST